MTNPLPHAEVTAVRREVTNLRRERSEHAEALLEKLSTRDNYGRLAIGPQDANWDEFLAGVRAGPDGMMAIADAVQGTKTSAYGIPMTDEQVAQIEQAQRTARG